MKKKKIGKEDGCIFALANSLQGHDSPAFLPRRQMEPTRNERPESLFPAPAISTYRPRMNKKSADLPFRDFADEKHLWRRTRVRHLLFNEVLFIFFINFIIYYVHLNFKLLAIKFPRNA